MGDSNISGSNHHKLKQKSQDVFKRIGPRISEGRKRRKGEEQGKITIIPCWTSISRRKNSPAFEKRKLCRKSWSRSASIYGRRYGILGSRSFGIGRKCCS